MRSKAHKQEQLNYDIIKDSVKERNNSQLNERQIQEENELLRLENKEMMKAVANIKVKTNKDLLVVYAEKEKQSEEVVGKFRHQAQIQEENLQIIKEQYLRLQQIYKSKIRNLDEALRKEQRAYDNLQLRRNLEIEGFHKDIDTIKRKAKIYDEYLNRMKKLTSEESKELGTCSIDL